MARKKKTFAGYNIRYLRLDDGLSQEKFAEKFGIDRNNLAKYETNAAEPDIDLVISICESYNKNVEEFWYKRLDDEQQADKRTLTIEELEQRIAGHKTFTVHDEGEEEIYQARKANPKIQFEVDYLIRRVAALQEQNNLLIKTVADKEKIISLQEVQLVQQKSTIKSNA